MKNLLAGLSLLAVVFVTGSAWAGHDHFNHRDTQGPAFAVVHSVPELDPTTAAAALVLVAGGVAIAHGRRRRAA